MRSLTKKPTTWQRATIVGIALLAFISSSIIISKVAAASATDGASNNGRLVTVYDRGTEKVILTKAATVGEAIHDAGIALDPKDAVDPAVAEKISSTDFTVNIYRARPVIVVDGKVRQKVMTPYQTPDQIAKDAGITLYDEDKTTISLSKDIIAQGAGLVMTVARATPITFVQYGKTITVRTQAHTAGEMLQEKGIVLAKNDVLSVPASTPITPQLKVELWRNGVQTVTEDEDIPFDVQQVQNADQPVGYKKVQTPGVPGKKTVTYQIEMKNGQEISRKAIQSVTTNQPKNQVEVIGTKLPTPANPSEAAQTGHQMMLSFGYSESEWPCLYNLWMRESGWNVTAGNPSSGAYGIPQSLPASKMAAYGSDYMTNAATQITWGLHYIQDRYSTPCGAWAHSQNVGWY